MKKGLLFVLALSFLSCDKEDVVLLDSESRVDNLNIVYVEEGDVNGRVLVLNEPIDYEFSNLDNSCDLTSYGLMNFSTPFLGVNLFGDSVTYPALGSIFGPNPFSDLTSIYPAHVFTAVLNDNVPFLQMLPPPPGPLLYTKINNFYKTYNFYDHGYLDPVSGLETHDYTNGSAASCNEIKKIIACQLLENANAIDPTAFIVDLVVDFNYIAAGGSTTSHVVNVYVRWGYHSL